VVEAQAEEAVDAEQGVEGEEGEAGQDEVMDGHEAPPAPVGRVRPFSTHKKKKSN